MVKQKHKIVERRKKAIKQELPELAVDSEKNDRRFELISIFILFLYGMYQSILLYGHHVMPSPDFPSFFDVGQKLWSFQIPTNYQRGPTYGLILYPLSLIVGGQQPALTAAWLFNSILQPCNLILIYLIAKRFVGKSAFWFALICILNPWLIEVFTKPLAEVCMLFFILITFFLMFRRSKLCYLSASIATLVRYECAFLILAAFIMDMIYAGSKKERIHAFIYSVLASVPMGIWMIGTIYFYPGEDSKTVHPLQFMNIQKLIDINILKREFSLLGGSTIGPLFRLSGKASMRSAQLFDNIAIIITSLSFIFGVVYGMVKKQWKMLAILIFFIFYMIIHILYDFSEPRFYVPVQWIFILFCFYGLNSFWQLINANNRIPKPFIIIGQVIVLLVFSLWISSLAYYFPILSDISQRPYFLPFAAMTASILTVAAYTYIYRGKQLWRNVVILSVICLMIISNQYAVAKVIQNGNDNIEFKLLLDWYLQNAKPGEKMVSSISSLLWILNPKNKEYFIVTGDLKADSPEDFIDNCYKEGITYIAWDSRAGFSTDALFYKLAKLENTAFLYNRQNIGPCEYITTVFHPTMEQRFINIFRLRPRTELPSGE